MNDGGPAWPVVTATETLPGGMKFEGTPGMSLRAWLAGQALAGCCANGDFTDFEKLQESPEDFAYRAASSACMIADATLAELAKQS